MQDALSGRRGPRRTRHVGLTIIPFSESQYVLVLVEQHVQEKKGGTVKTAGLLTAVGCVQRSGVSRSEDAESSTPVMDASNIQQHWCHLEGREGKGRQ